MYAIKVFLRTGCFGSHKKYVNLHAIFFHREYSQLADSLKDRNSKKIKLCHLLLKGFK